MKKIALFLVLAVIPVTGVAQEAPSAETLTTLKLVRQFNPKYSTPGAQFDGSAVECVAGIKNEPLARATASNRARAACAFAQTNDSFRKIITSFNVKVIDEAAVGKVKKILDSKPSIEALSQALSSFISAEEFQPAEGGIVCARAKPIF